MDNLQLISIVLESVIAVSAMALALLKRKVYGYGLAVTFAIYVFYDLVKLFNLQVSSGTLAAGFFVATLSALWAVLKMFKD